MTVLEIGPATVRVVRGAGGPVDPRLAEAALWWIDDPVGLYDEHPVAVSDLWREVMTAAVGEDAVVLVHPDDWTRRRVGRVVAAADAVAGEVVAVPRRQWTADVERPGGRDGGAEGPGRLRRPRAVALALAAGAAVSLAGAAIAVRPPATQTVVEGRIAVRFPADWTVARVTAGPGSRRLQAAPAADPELAVHVTQSYAPESTPAGTAAVLRRAIADQPAGVFVNFRADGRAAGRPAVTYREVRPGRVVDWSVVLVGSTRIGFGCQSPPQRTHAVRDACEQAIASAGEEDRRDR